MPLTSRFVAERADELRSLPSFGPAREAAVEAGVAAPYLEARGESVPADPGERAERMLTVFISALWEGCTGFSLDRERLDSALSMLDAEARDADDADVADRPDRRPADVDAAAAAAARRADRPRRLDRGADRGDAQRGHGPRRLGAAVPRRRRAARRAKAPRRRCSQLRELISVMRLFKGGGIGLGPYAFAPTGEGCWRRIATGAPATRPGGYRLSEEEAERAGRARERRWRRAPTPTAPSPGRSAASRWAASARARSTASATTCWRCARCSRATARSAPRCRCAPRR